MNTPRPRLVPLLLALTLAALGQATAQGQYTLLRSLFNPGTNAQAGAQQGYAVAADGNIAVVGAPHDDVGTTDSGVAKVYDATTGAFQHTLKNPSPEASARFGWSVAVSGLRVVVGAPYAGTGPIYTGRTYVYDLTGPVPTVPVATLTNPSPAYQDYFGTSVAISGNLLVVGAYGDDTGATDTGSAYVYDLTSVTPTVPVTTLTNPTPAQYEKFGYAVVISATRVVVGAPSDNTGAIQAGSAYVFDLASAIPNVPVLTLTNPSPQGGDGFGSSAAFSGTRLVIGAAGDSIGAVDAGTAYVYDFSSATPVVPLVTLTNPNPATVDFFGTTVSISGSRVAVGANRDRPGAQDVGGAYVFDLATAAPVVPVLTLTNPSPVAFDYFGHAVAISGTRLVVGAYGDDTGATNAGSAYLYDLAGAVPAVPTAILNQPSPASDDPFGSAVAVAGSLVAVGFHQSDAGATDSGSVHVYDLAGAMPAVPVLTLVNPAPAAGDHFGLALAMSGRRIVVGAYGYGTSTYSAGVAYVYDLTAAIPAMPVFTLTNPSPAAGDYFGSSVAFSNEKVVVGAADDDAVALNSGVIYVYDLMSAAPTRPVITLTNPVPQMFARFGSGVGISSNWLVVGAECENTGASCAGSAYVFNLSSSTPTAPVAILHNPNASDNGYFGHSVAGSGAFVVIGAPQNSFGVFRGGNAYVYCLTNATPFVPVAALTNPSGVRGEYFGSAVGISGSRVVVGAYLAELSGGRMGGAYVYELAGGTPSVPVAALANPNPAVSQTFGYAVAIDEATVAVTDLYDGTDAANRGAAYVFGIPPTLYIARTALGSAVLWWTPTNSPGFVLQYTESLVPTNWVNAPSGAANPVTVSTTNAARFYRLAQL